MAVVAGTWPGAVHPARGEPVERFEVPGGHYLLARPAGYETGHRPPLIIALHGTQTTADDLLKLWSGLDHPFGMLIVSPQNGSAGWEDGDALFLQAVYRDLEQRMSFDARRVLLTGHSAGGAMCFYMLYNAGFPVSAVATSANYLPPTVTANDIRARSEIPVFYAVGREDLHHVRMHRASLLLRNNGTSVRILTLDIGHVIEPRVMQAAADWFIEVGDRQSVERMAQARRDLNEAKPAGAARATESIVEQRLYHSPDIAEAAQAIYGQAVGPGNSELYAIRRLISEGRGIEAYDRLLRLEQEYAGCAWVEKPIALRRELARSSEVVRELTRRDKLEHRRKAQRILQDARKQIQERRYEQARALCRLLIERYAELPEGEQAVEIMKSLQWKGD